jgi:hypothetical protein
MARNSGRTPSTQGDSAGPYGSDAGFPPLGRKTPKPGDQSPAPDDPTTMGASSSMPMGPSHWRRAPVPAKPTPGDTGFWV